MLSLARARPQTEDELQKSISAVLKSLEADPTVSPASGRYHPKIITKYDFLQTRNKKSHIELPAEFVVSTNLNVNTKQNYNLQSPQTENFRSSRSNKIFSPSRKARQGFRDLASAVRNAPVVVGERKPDDETDRVVHRGGRFINNMYVPDPAVASANKFSMVPEEVVIRAELGPGPELARAGRSYEDGYYNTNEFTFTPLQHFEQQQQQQQSGAAVFPADNKDFVIEMQTYQQCPGCPTFSVPVPIPKFSADTTPVTERKEEKTLLGRLAAIVKPAIARAKEFFRVGDSAPVDQISSRVDTVAGQSKLAAPLVASLAAVGFGLVSMFGNNLGSGRKFDTENNAEYFLNTIDGELDNLSQYSVDEMLCLPRQYCDTLKDRKHLLDSYPNMKTVAAWLTEKYFENTWSEDYSHSQCNVRQCLKDLLN